VGVSGDCLRVALYARVSDKKLTEEGKRRQDVMRQVDMLREYCKRVGYEVIEPPYIDDGLSAWTDDLNSRPAFAKLRSDMLQGHIKKVLIESLDRFSSDMCSGMGYLKEWSDRNAIVQSLQAGEHEVTTDDGWMKNAIFLMLAEYRIRSLRSKVRSGMARRANDERAKCRSCGIIHMGRHPKSCKCLKCLKKKGGV